MTSVARPPATPDWRKVVPPPRLARRPRDTRGFIIPFSVDDGTPQPDFRMTQPERIRELLTARACWLCGDRLDHWLCFIGGPLSIANHAFTDGPMHEACAVYALRVCPFLASPRGHYTSEERPPEDSAINPYVADNRPTIFGLGFTDGFITEASPNGMLYMRARPWRKVIWYSEHGRIVRTQVFQTTRYQRKTKRYG